MADSSSVSIFVGNKLLTRELTIILPEHSTKLADKLDSLKTMTSYFMTGDVRVTLFKHDYPTGREEFMSELFIARDSLPAYTQACDFVSSVIKFDRGDKVAAIKLNNETV